MDQTTMRNSWTLSLLALAATTVPAVADQGNGTKYATPKPQAAPRAIQLASSSALVGGSDNCATPDVLVGVGTFLFDNTIATTGAEGQAEALCTFFGFTTIDQDVWFSWTATSSGILNVTTCGFTAVDTKIAIYDGATCPTGPAIGCNDDACPGFQTTVGAPVVVGQNYLIQVGTYPGAGGGTGSISLGVSPQLANDACATPTTISGSGPFVYDTTNATRGAQGQANARCLIFNTSNIDFDAWYSWTAPSTGWYSVNTCVGGLHDLKMAIYAGTGCPSTEPLTCDDDMCGTIGGAARTPFFATAGLAYTLQLGSYPGQAGAPGQFTIDPFTPAAADDCAAPTVVTGSGPHAWDQANATTGFDGQAEANCASEMITYDLWYSWTSNCTGTVMFSLCNQSGNDTKIAVYPAGGCPTAQTSLACNDDFCGPGGPSETTFAAVLGQTYLLQIGSWPGEVPGSGTFSLMSSCPVAPGTGYCFGDGSGGACPCGNLGAAGNGCASSINASGGNLAATGSATIGSDTVVLRGSGLPNSTCLYFQGTTQISPAFGDGLRCAGGTIIRLGTKVNVAGASQYPVGADQPVSVRGGVTVPGSTRNYQVWYRNSAPFCTAATFNLTNGYSITWQ